MDEREIEPYIAITTAKVSPS